MERVKGRRAVVVGGSIGGLTTGLLLRDLGFSVDIFERTPEELEGRGAGLVLQAEAYRWFKERSNVTLDGLSTESEYIRYFNKDDTIAYQEPVHWRFTSWGTLYRGLLSDFGRDHYHLGQCFVGIDQDDDTVTLRFTNGRVEQADLVVFADGVTSTGRRRLIPDWRFEFSGYVGWRGTVPERAVSPAAWSVLNDSLAWYFGDRTHICMYPIPGPRGETAIGERLLNYVWYRNVPDPQYFEEIMTDTSGIRSEVSVHPGKVQQRFVEEMRAAATSQLNPAAADLVLATEQPYIQAVVDYRPPQMAFGRAVLLGDAGFVARPHGAAGTAKAGFEAWELADALESGSGDIRESLQAWDPIVRHVGNGLVDRVVTMGNRAQFICDWEPPSRDLRFGLQGGILEPQY